MHNEPLVLLPVFNGKGLPSAPTSIAIVGIEISFTYILFAIRDGTPLSEAGRPTLYCSGNEA